MEKLKIKCKNVLTNQDETDILIITKEKDIRDTKEKMRIERKEVQSHALRITI
jgi:hypothetical protein